MGKHLFFFFELSAFCHILRAVCESEVNEVDRHLYSLLRLLTPHIIYIEVSLTVQRRLSNVFTGERVKRQRN